MTEKQLDELLVGITKPARYTGGEFGSVMKDLSSVELRYAFCFPDTYEIGMSHLGMKILYSLINEMDGVWCERAFAPWIDMENRLIEKNMGVFTLESHTELSEFDLIGFTLQYEMSYTNVLNMLKLSNIPLRSKDRKGLKNMVCFGGPCTCNIEPMADFADAVFLGEGEEHTVMFIELYRRFVRENRTKDEFLREAAKIKGVYIPSLYDVEYNDDGTVKEVKPKDNSPLPITKYIIEDLDNMFAPKQFVVPYIETVHDRAVQEVFRGCIRGCRFCQAGMIYRPVREKSVGVVNKQARTLCDNTGYDEISLCSLSTSDYTEIEPLLNDLLDWTNDEKINISLPSMRIDSFSPELLQKISQIRKSGLTFAPEAGTQRMRDVINKNLSEEIILSGCRDAFRLGQTTVKLYFMLGLPYETMDDVLGIGRLAQKIVDMYYSMPDKPKGKSVQVTIGLATFVPKPHTPFQWAPQDMLQTVRDKQYQLVGSITTRKITVNWHDSDTSLFEAVLARGDRRLSNVLEYLVMHGSRLDSWGECFEPEKWADAFEKCGLSPEFYANRERSYDEVLPWEHLDYGVTKRFLMSENEKAKAAATTPNCREKCAGCGANKLMSGGKCPCMM